MGESFYPEGLNARERGYSAGLIGVADAALQADAERELWMKWQEIFSRAKLGDFTGVAELIEVYKQTRSWTLARSCADLLGDAGNPACFERVIAAIAEGSKDGLVNLRIKVDFCRALAAWGRLSVVPILLDTYFQVQSFDDAEIIPVCITRLIEGQILDPAGPTTEQRYRRDVTERYEQVVEQFGSDEVLVFHAGVYSVIALAKRLLSELKKGRFVGSFRLRFEASTGIDCTKFYERGIVQTTAATSIVEQFLASPDARKYEEGARYFFGHPIGK